MPGLLHLKNVHRGRNLAWVGDIQSFHMTIALYHAKSIVVNKLAVTFFPAGVGGSLFHGSTQFLRTFFHSLGGLFLKLR